MLGADHSGNVCWATHSRAMLSAVLDAVLPSYQVRERHQITVYASPEAALAAALTPDFSLRAKRPVPDNA